jgi:transposase
MQITMIGLDLAKRVFQVHGVDAEGGAVVRRPLRRSEVKRFFAALAPCVVGMEACATAHYWARELGALGHEVRLVPPSYVRPYVKRGKNDAVDAEAICEAMSRPGMRFVPVKTTAQQAEVMPHRVRDLLVRQRTMAINALRAHLAEFGIVAAQGRGGLATLIERLHTASEDELPAPACAALMAIVAMIRELDARVAGLEKAIVAHTRADPVARRLITIPGVGPIGASALSAMAGDPTRFQCGRHFSAWLGLVPRQNSTGGKRRLGRISKKGDRYLRKLLVLGATSYLRQARHEQTPLAAWTRRLLQRRSARLVTVALANKMARIVWAVIATGETYHPQAAAV